MDSTALSLCMDNHLPIVVFNMNDRGQHRSDNFRRASGDAGEDMSLIDELLAGRARAHGQVRGGDARQVRLGAHRPREPGAARPHQRRLLRRPDAAQAARDDQRPRGAAADRAALRQELDQGDRAGDPGVRHRPHAEQRRHDHPPADPGADRGAAQAARQGRARASPRRAASRSATSAATSCTTCASCATPARPAPTTSTAPRRRCRSSPTRRSPSSTALLKGKEEEILEV